MNPPCEGMKSRPYGEHYMAPMWAACVKWALSEKDARDRFAEETGFNISSLVNRSPMDRMIDQATGYEAEVLAAFCDWVTTEFWGTEETEEPIPHPAQK